jgi:ABC-type sugar transport system ATPase subunit
MKDIEKSFSTVQVLGKISLSMKKGMILGIVGENGAGKSTLMNILGGIIKKDAGEILLGGEIYEPKNPTDAKKHGITFIHQELNLFENLSVAENLFIDEFPKKGGPFVDYRYMSVRAKEVLDMLSTSINVNRQISEYSMGIRQTIEIAKSLLRDVKILIFDEPTSSLSNSEKAKLFTVIKNLQNRGVSIIYISHMLEEVFGLCDEILVIRDGKSIAQQKTAALDMDSVVKMMVGREITNLYPYVDKTYGKEIFTVTNLCCKKKFRGIYFSLKEGEIVGMFGLVGSGRSEMARAIFGLDTHDNGVVKMNNVTLKGNPIDSIGKGMAFITENRKEEGLLLNKCVNDNLTLATIDDFRGRFSIINQAKEKDACEKIITLLKIKIQDQKRQAVKNLSGGNQQKVVIGKWLIRSPKVFIMDEPAKGVDVGAKFEIYNYINWLALRGTSILVISSEMEELIGICDRVLVMSNGRITGEIFRGDFSKEKIMEYALQKGIEK